MYALISYGSVDKNERLAFLVSIIVYTHLFSKKNIYIFIL